MFDILPRAVIAGLKGGSGKTILSLGLISSWLEEGHRVSPFKKGPDFIDAGWLGFAAGRPCRNLDLFLMPASKIVRSFFMNSADADISLIEGNRGLFDGLDLEGRCSTAELAKLLKCPVFVIVDVTMATRTIAALLMGCQTFDPDLNIVGAILNRVAGSRQESLVRSAIERYCGLPVIGSVPKLKENLFPERHMGLVPHRESSHAAEAVEWAKRVVAQHLDTQEVWRLAHRAAPLEPIVESEGSETAEEVFSKPPRIGFVRDKSFWFYYPENLEQLTKLGATLEEVNSISDVALPKLDALYIGGGFPETQAEGLANNRTFRESLKSEVEKGLPVYAECGGLMYLGEHLIVDEKRYPMAGVLPIDWVMENRPQGHGYTMLQVDAQNPFYPKGQILKGHEFRYLKPLIKRPNDIQTVFKVLRGHGLDGERDGIVKKSLLATLTHIHATGEPSWGKRFFSASLRRRQTNNKNFSDHKEKRD